MTNHMQFSLTPPSFWQAACQTGRSFFHSAVWQNLLASSFGTTTIYSWSKDHSICIAIPVFSAGPFRIGYIGFPVGGGISKNVIDEKTLLFLQNSMLPSPIHLLRVPTSQINENSNLGFSYTQMPETFIQHLQSWNESSLKKRVRRDINKSLRSNLTIIDARNKTDAIQIFDLYKSTIQRNAGNFRYNEHYFQEALSLSLSLPNVRCLLALHQNSIAGFVIVILDGTIAYYLHGGVNQELKHLYPSDLLLNHAIHWAQDEGMKTFNFMTSPEKQPSLIKYKEKWGAITRPHHTYKVPIRPIYSRLFSVTEKIYYSVR